MALTIETNPTSPTPAFNEQRLVLSSTNSGETGFEYIVTLRAGNAGGTALGDPITLRKSPDPNGYGVFDLSKLTADYVDTDFTGNIDTFQVNTNTSRVFFFETLADWDAGNEIGATGIYSAFNGILSVEDWIGATNDNWSFDIAYPPAQGMMSNYRSIQKSKIDECGFLYFQSRRSTQITGADLVTNGTFTTNLTGWTLDAAGDWTWDSGLAKSKTASTSGNFYGISQIISGLTVGNYYELSFNANLGKGSLVISPTNETITTTTGNNYGTIKYIFKATLTSHTVGFVFIPSANNEWATIDTVSFQEIEILPFSAEIKTYNSSNTLINTFVLKNTSTSEFQYNWLRYNTNTDSGFLCWRLPAGAKNLNLIDNADLSTGTQPIITSTVSYWIIKIKTSAGNLFGEYKCYLNSQCSKYKSFRLHWLNRLGGYDSFTFDMASQEDINIERNFYNRLMREPNKYTSTKSYDYTTREETQYHSQYKTLYSVASNWISEDESNMLAELMTSPNVYWEKDADNNKFIPINIKATTYRKQSKTNNNTKIFNHEFQFEVSYNEKIQGR